MDSRSRVHRRDFLKRAGMGLAVAASGSGYGAIAAEHATALQKFYTACRVENWRGGASGRWLGWIRGFPLRARLAVSVAPFPVPATSHAA